MNNFVNRRQFLKTLSSGTLSAALLEELLKKFRNTKKLLKSPELRYIP
jgi:hypothetical protein